MAGTDATTGPPSGLTGPVEGTRFRVDWVATTGSTNADLLTAADRGAPEGAVLVADHQTAGRGRRGRSWTAPPGAALLVSILVRPPLPPARAGVLSAAVGLAAASACEAVAGVRPGLKWPNDLVVGTDQGERKLGGILAESRVAEGRLVAAVVGLGLNLTWPASVPDELADIAVALDQVAPEGDAGGATDRSALLASLLTELERRLVAIESGDDHLVWSDWREAAVTLGRTVRVETHSGVLRGVAQDVTDDGRLALRGEDGEAVTVDAGDVVHVRPEESA